MKYFLILIVLVCTLTQDVKAQLAAGKLVKIKESMAYPLGDNPTLDKLVGDSIMLPWWAKTHGKWTKLVGYKKATDSLLDEQQKWVSKRELQEGKITLSLSDSSDEKRRWPKDQYILYFADSSGLDSSYSSDFNFSFHTPIWSIFQAARRKWEGKFLWTNFASTSRSVVDFKGRHRKVIYPFQRVKVLKIEATSKLLPYHFTLLNDRGDTLLITCELTGIDSATRLYRVKSFGYQLLTGPPEEYWKTTQCPSTDLFNLPWGADSGLCKKVVHGSIRSVHLPGFFLSVWMISPEKPALSDTNWMIFWKDTLRTAGLGVAPKDSSGLVHWVEARYGSATSVEQNFILEQKWLFYRPDSLGYSIEISSRESAARPRKVGVAEENFDVGSEMVSTMTLLGLDDD